MVDDLHRPTNGRCMSVRRPSIESYGRSYGESLIEWSLVIMVGMTNRAMIVLTRKLTN